VAPRPAVAWSGHGPGGRVRGAHPGGVLPAEVRSSQRRAVGEAADAVLQQAPPESLSACCSHTGRGHC